MSHRTYVVPKPRGYAYRCSCGAEGYVSQSSAAAKQAGRDHEKKRNK
jgi:hypothetical protein